MGRPPPTPVMEKKLIRRMIFDMGGGHTKNKVFTFLDELEALEHL